MKHLSQTLWYLPYVGLYLKKEKETPMGFFEF